MPSRLTEDKRRYLYAVYVDDTNVIVRWLLQFGWFRDKWERYWKKRVNRMTEGEVLKEYYEKLKDCKKRWQPNVEAGEQEYPAGDKIKITE